MTGPQPDSGIGWPFSVYGRFDAGHFMRIAHYGFFSRGPSDTNVAFFPGYPMAGRLLSEAFGFGEVTRLDRLIAFGPPRLGGGCGGSTGCSCSVASRCCSSSMPGVNDGPCCARRRSR